MSTIIKGPTSRLIFRPERLSQDLFSAFGAVIENPAPSLIPSLKLSSDGLPPKSVLANQGSALKYLDVTVMKNLYEAAPSQCPSKAVMNMFVCAPRPLAQSLNISGPDEEFFSIDILERHPFTTQTFIPLGLSALHVDQARYLVIVAPSLSPSPADGALPVPSSGPSGESLPGRGFPDLSGIRAFIADGSQAVTYGAGTWHAPMVVVGTKAIDFVVVQFANGVALEDCQEVSLEEHDKGKMMVAIPRIANLSRL